MFGRDCCDLGTAWLPRRRGLTGDHLSPGGSTGETHVPDAAHSAPVCNSLPFQLHVALGLRVTALGERGQWSRTRSNASFSAEGSIRRSISLTGGDALDHPVPKVKHDGREGN